MTADERETLAAEYVLGLLDPGAMKDAEGLLSRDEAFAASVAAWQERFGELDRTIQPLPVPASMWHRIEQSLDVPQVASPKTPTRALPASTQNRMWSLRSLWQSLGFWRGAGLAAAAASLLLSIALGVMAVQAGRKPVMIAVLLTDVNQPAAVVNTYPDGRAELVPLTSIDVPPDRALQIWTLWDRARGPVSIGLIDQARSVPLAVEDLPRTGSGQLFEITLEPRTGSPTGRPTGPILMKGTASSPL
jgi:anti-sigma-K factor RskA